MNCAPGKIEFFFSTSKITLLYYFMALKRKVKKHQNHKSIKHYRRCKTIKGGTSMSELDSFDLMLEEIKQESEKAKETIEIAEQLSEIIGTITEERIEQGLTQRDLAKLSGIKQSAIARMESIQVVPRLDTLIKIARCLGIKLKAERKEDVKESASATVYSFYDYNNTDTSYGWLQPSYIMTKALEGAV